MTPTHVLELPKTSLVDPSEVPARPEPRPGWRADAACLNDPDPDKWVDLPQIRSNGRNNPGYDTHLQHLARTCSTCPVRAWCLWESLDSTLNGVFAGTDEYMRADIRDLLGLPAPQPLVAPENPEEARLTQQRFDALHMARQQFSNTEIALALGVSTMAVSRLTNGELTDTLRRTRQTA